MSFPSRSAPIKEQTVAEYILEAAQEEFPIDWARYCDQVGLDREIFSAIQGAISKVGPEKLKPIKNELPEDISYAQIKSALVMQKLGISPELIPASSQNTGNDIQLPNEASEETASVTFATGQVTNVPSVHEEDPLLKKRQKVGRLEEGGFVSLKATENSIVDWLKNYDAGVSLSDILEHFNGSDKKSVLDLLSHLEADFSIYMKNNVYRIM